jgi:hypothetical protein
MSQHNCIKVSGKTLKGTEEITLNLADDQLEVRGFGKPVSAALAKKMASEYFKDADEASKLIGQIEGNDAFAGLQGSALEALKRLLDPEKHIVSGVFGKEIILQLLSQKDCEGIRYIFGRDEGRTTIILIGVKQIEGKFSRDKNGSTIALSEPIGPKDFFKNLAPDSAPQAGDPPVPEVHLASKTIAEIKSELGVDFLEDPTNVLFGAF